MIEQSKEELGKLSIAILVFYACMLFLNGESLLRNAELLPYGKGRRVAVALVRPFANVSSMGPGMLRSKVESVHDEYWKGVK